jgi:hypothetical protein
MSINAEIFNGTPEEIQKHIGNSIEKRETLELVSRLQHFVPGVAIAIAMGTLVTLIYRAYPIIGAAAIKDALEQFNKLTKEEVIKLEMAKAATHE